MNQHDQWLMRRHAIGVMDSMPQNALLLIKGDIHHNTLHYLQMCEGYRPDVKLGMMTS